VYDPRRRDFGRREDILAEVGQLVQSPVLYLQGHDAPILNGQHKEILKKYIEEGGFVLGEACCGSREFTEGFRRLMAELFPETPLRPLPPEHPIWRSHRPVPPSEFPNMLAMDRGCRTVVVLSADPIAGYWEQTKFTPKPGAVPANRGELAYLLGGNIIAYATGMEPPKQRLSFTRIVETGKDRTPPRGYLKPAQIRLPGEPPPAPAAMRNLMNYLRNAARIDAVLQTESLTVSDDDLFKFRFLYAHGRKAFQFTPDEILNLKATLQAGGTLFADACCGSPEFTRAFEALLKQLYPDRSLEPIPADDFLYSEQLNGTAIRTVRRRETVDATKAETGYQELPPRLEGIRIDGRWAVIFSRYDIGCALEGHKSSDCLGHTRESAERLAAAVVLYALKQ
jgi:hypothetical protein